MKHNEVCEKLNLENNNENLKKENKNLKEKNVELKNTIKILKDIKKKSYLLIGVFIVASISMSSFLIVFDGKIGTFVQMITTQYNESNSTSPITRKISYVKSIDQKNYLRDSTPIFYGFLFFLFLIVLILFFEYKKYEALKDE